MMNNKIKLILCLVGLSVISGCATRAQTVALTGVVTGAVIANEVNRAHTPPTTVIVQPLRCHNQYIGRDVYGRTIYNQVCK